MLDLPLSGIKRIESIAQSSSEYISLSQGALKINGIPKQVKEELKKLLDTNLTDYYQSAWGIMPLREKLAQIIKQDNKVDIPVSQILVTHGCIGALSTTFFTLLEPGEEVIIPEPTYPAYESLTKLVRAKPVFVSCLAENEKDKFWNLDIEKIKAAKTSKTKIVIFSNPWNPFGLTVNRKKILELLDWCQENEIYLIIDEAYKDYGFDNNFESCVSLIPKSEWLITVDSFSKNMAMSGWRVGYLVVPEKLSLSLGKTQDAMLNCPNVPGQYAALYSLDHPEFTQNFHNIIKSNLDITKKALAPLIKEKIFEYQDPSGGFYLFLKTQFKDSTNLCSNLLQQAKVALIPGKFFGQSGASFIRLCYAREPQVLQEGLKRILNYFS